MGTEEPEALASARGEIFGASAIINAEETEGIINGLLKGEPSEQRAAQGNSVPVDAVADGKEVSFNASQP